MKVRYNQDEVESRCKNKFNESLHVLKSTSGYFRKFNDFVRKNTNFFESRISLMGVQCVCDQWMYDDVLGKNVRGFAKDKDGNYDMKAGYLILRLAGGKNGCGAWRDYFEDLALLFGNFSSAGYKPWLIGIDNDCSDDVFYMTMGIR